MEIPEILYKDLLMFAEHNIEASYDTLKQELLNENPDVVPHCKAHIAWVELHRMLDEGRRQYWKSIMGVSNEKV
mgnify:CR=1 FL=1